MAETDPGWDATPEEVTAHALTRLDSTIRRQRVVRDSLLTELAGAADSADPQRMSSLAARLLGMPSPPEPRQLEARVERLESELDEA